MNACGGFEEKAAKDSTIERMNKWEVTLPLPASLLEELILEVDDFRVELVRLKFEGKIKK